MSIDEKFIDDRFVAELSQLLNDLIHIISQFLTYELIEKQGLLIEEKILAARLGIDIENSRLGKSYRIYICHKIYRCV